ncbi:hypothetical protein [Psychroserpens burtonensis]|uniref:hypothetical protein n=1 Tax=Psychroserpens burtonensis TaxID=49278 RepID=UPI000685C1FE|nr:hypothetical protein [Psychroserpens burtonensis]
MKYAIFTNSVINRNVMSKNLYSLSVALLLTLTTFAQAPEKMSYQAVVRDSGDNLVSGQVIGMQISILQTTSSGTAVYVETQTPSTNVNGLVTLEIGTGSVVSGDFTTIDWSSDTYFVKTETDPTGGISYTIAGTSQLLSVPYALHAKTAENVINDEVDDADADATNELQNLEQLLIVGNNANLNSIVNTGQIGIGTATPNVESSMEITTALPLIFPSMTQNEVNAMVTPVEGMVQFNTDAHKLQVYSMLTNNAAILNEIYLGTDVNDFFISQFGTSPIDGQIIAVELLLKDDLSNPFPEIDFQGQGSFTVPSYGSFTWFTFVLPNPIQVTAGGSWNIDLIGPGVLDRRFATNSSYPDGGGCCFPGADDLLFRVHIQPNPGSFGWQNMH